MYNIVCLNPVASDMNSITYSKKDDGMYYFHDLIVNTHDFQSAIDFCDLVPPFHLPNIITDQQYTVNKVISATSGEYLTNLTMSSTLWTKWYLWPAVSIWQILQWAVHCEQSDISDQRWVSDKSYNEQYTVNKVISATSGEYLTNLTMSSKYTVNKVISATSGEHLTNLTMSSTLWTK